MTAPAWLNQEDPLHSTVKYVASISPNYNWVGLYFLKGDYLEVGPYIGAPTEHTKIPVGQGICGRAISENKDLNIPNVHLEENYLACSLETKSELVVLIRNKRGEILGQIDIDSHTRDAFNPADESKVREAADILGSFLD